MANNGAVNWRNRKVSAGWAFVLATIVGAFAIDYYLAFTEVGIFHGATMAQLFQWDWSNVVGRAAFDEGGGAVALGISLHLLVSAVWAAVCVVLVRRVKWLAEHPIVWGIVFGLIVMCVMRYGVVPLGHATKPHANALWMANLICAHTIFFGIPVALVARGAR